MQLEPAGHPTPGAPLASGGASAASASTAPASGKAL